MLPSIPPWGVLLLVVSPAFVRWWWGRPLAGRADDPVLPERLLANNKRCSVVTAISILVLIFARDGHGVWAIPCVYAANLVAAFPLRKTLYEETWTLLGFLSFYGRLWFGFLGFWILMMATPALANSAGRWYWTVTLALGITLAAWNALWPAFVRRLLHVRPIEDAHLLARFDALVARSTAARPRFAFVPMRGGMLVNALALPAFRESSVIFTETLLSRFSEDEIAAICAHELAHLEYYNPSRLRRLSALTSLLIVAAVFIGPLSVMLGANEWTTAFWVPAILTGLALRVRRRRKNETAADVRAVALTGDPEALARALTKLHTIARVPRRWGQRHEEHATHPSLARRIRDIRASAGIAPAVLETPVTFEACSGSPAITFDRSQVRWRDGGTMHALDYARLVELRLAVTAGGTVTLVAADTDGRRRRMTPRADDVVALQAVLDVVDGRLRHEPVPRAFSPAVTRLVAALAVGLSWILSQGVFAFVAMLAALIPAPALLNGAGVAGIAVGVLLAVRTSDLAAGVAAGLCIALALCLLALGWVRRRERPRGTVVLLGSLLVASAVALVAIVAGGVSLVRLHQGARAEPAAFVLLAAFAAAAWTYERRRTWRYGAAAAALASIATFVLGTSFFLRQVARDPFQVAGQAASTSPVQGKPAWEFRVPFPVESLRVSTNGLLAAVSRSESDENDARSTRAPRVFQIVAPGRTMKPLEADDFVFTSDSRALVFRTRAGAAELSEVDLDSNAVIWRNDLGDLKSGSVAYRVNTKTWSVDATDDHARLVRITGGLGGRDIARALGPAWRTGNEWVEAWAAGTSGILTLEKRFEAGLMRPRRLPALLSGFQWLVRTRSSLTVSQSRSNAVRLESELEASCLNDALETGWFACAVFDGDRTHVLAFDPDTGCMTPLATIDGHLWFESSTEPGWIAGMWDGTPAVLRIGTRELIFPADDDDAMTIAANETVLATADYGRRASTLRVYRRKSIAE